MGMQERRKSPRFKCRLHCTVRRGEDRIRGRVLDVSDGGLCLLSCVEMQRVEECRVEIERPCEQPVVVGATVWHTRALQSRTSGLSFSSVGLLITSAGSRYQSLIEGVAADAARWSTPGSALDEAGREVGLAAFRVRVKSTSGPRTRLLTVAAVSEDEARRAATKDLEGRWSILEVKRA